MKEKRETESEREREKERERIEEVSIHEFSSIRTRQAGS